MIHVYDIGNTDFDGLGDAILQPLSGTVKQAAGGSYDIQMEVAMDPEGKWKHLVPGAIVKASVPEEVIENAYAGLDADVYKTNTEAALREGASEPTAILYPEWNPNTVYEVGSKVRCSAWSHKNYQCIYYDGTSPQVMVPPYNSAWWKPIADKTTGAAALVTLAAGSELYFVEDYDTDWYKMSTFYGLVGYIKKNQVTFDRHLTPSETTPRIITEQLFRITEPTVDSIGQKVSVSGMHVSYDLAGILIQDVSIGQASPAMAIGLMMEGMMVPYDGIIATNLTSDANGTYTGQIKGKSAMYALLDPDAGIASSFNAKFTRDNWDVFLMQRTTVDRGYRIRYGKNARGITWEKSSANLINRVVPVAKDEKGADLYLPEKWIDSPLISQYPVIRMERLQVKGQVGKDKGNNDGSVWTESDLLDEMRAKAAERFSVDHADLVSHEVTVQVEQLGDTVEYEWMKGLETVLLYDTVAAIDENIGLVMPLLVTEIEWDIVRNRIAGLKLSNKNDLKKRTVTGYNVQNNSISSEKLMDGVAQDIVQAAVDIMPEYAEPFDNPTHLNTKDQDGIVTKGNGQATKVWKTDAQGNPAWRDGNFILASEKGQQNGVATLDSAGKVPESQMPSYVDDIIEGYLYNGQFYKNSAHTQLITPETGKIYVDISTGDNLEYRWSGSVYSQISKTSVNDSDPTLAWGTRSKVGDVAGVSLHVTMPGNPASGKKNTQTAVNDPTASGTSVTFIDSISQDAQGVITPTKKTVRTMGGATSDANGSTGLVPMPTAGKQNKFLRGDGTWDYPEHALYYGVCNTAAATQNKEFTIDNFPSSLVEGVRVRVKFTYAQEYDGYVRMRVNSTSFKWISLYGTTRAQKYAWRAGEVIDFVYDGSYWVMVGGGRINSSGGTGSYVRRIVVNWVESRWVASFITEDGASHYVDLNA